MKRLTFTYVTAYLLIGGLGLAFMPDIALVLLLSNGDYGDIMPRVAGALMIGLGGLVGNFVYYGDYRYYGFSIFLRTFFVIFFFFLYARSVDPLFLALNVIILIGLLPSIYVALREWVPGRA